MKKLGFILISILLPFLSMGQVSDDFSDGDFTANPVWKGDSSLFKISTYSNSGWSVQPRLQLNGTASDTSVLYIASNMVNLNNKEWDIWVRLALNTSKSNNCRVYLVSDSPDLKSALHGYFVMFGDDANDQLDSISLWKQNGNSVQKLIAGHHTFTGASGNYHIKVTRDNTGNWLLSADATGGNNFTLEGTAIDNSMNTSAYMGVFCKYTSTNKTNFYFDDIYAGSQIVDTVPPQVASVHTITANQLDVMFNENMNSTTAQNIANYFVAGIGNPSSATVDAVNGALLHLTVATSFTAGTTYSIHISGATDASGNMMTPVDLPFAFYKIKPYDIVINEIMADPTPVVALPAYEYLELFNTTHIPISLSGYKIAFGNSIKPLPDVAIQPLGYLILAPMGSSSLFSQYGAVAEISGFSLTNTGQIIALLDSSQRIISFVNYSDKWYRNTVKDDGGWALERIDASNACGEINNWKVSIDASGGTPGRANSVAGNNPDVSPPVLIRASANRYDLNTVKIYFNETLDSIKMKAATNYHVDNGLGNPYLVKLSYPDNSMVTLSFSAALQAKTIYTLNITDSILDCAGNKLPAFSSARLAIPELPDSGDLVINEVLSNPKDDGVDFVEIYNRSEKILDYKDLMLGSENDFYIIADNNFLSFPGDYTLLSSDADMVKSQYYTSNPYGFITMESFPGLLNDEGSVILKTNSDTIVDFMVYTADMHFPLLATTDGVSLERIDYNRPASDITNWHSAAETVGYATPAYKNSQFMKGEAEDGMLTLSPEIFSPDQDGYNDVLNIICKTDGPGKVVNIVIYDSKGRLVKTLVKSSYISGENTYTWDGTKDNNQKANIGIYIVYAELFDAAGKVKHYKKTAVLATKF